ncbi:hypothetical protein GALL_503080 [mine drainage metagenome]|uniref:Uncharacterized protein n=1 Tax=mine drainage metagenome TaxID=410659 RepID=A0A1J5PBK2_9ZZZZ
MLGLDPPATEAGQEFVDDEVAARDEWRLGGVLPRVALPDEHFLGDDAFLHGLVHGDIRELLVIQQLSGAVVGVHGDEHTALGIGDALATGLPGEAAEYLAVDHTQPGAGQHGDGQLGGHGQVQGHPVAPLEAADIPEQGRELVHADPELLVRHVLDGLLFRLRHEVERRLVAVRGQVAVHAVVANIQLSAHEPFPEGRLGGIEGLGPGLVPVEQVGVFVVALGEVLLGEPLKNAAIRHVGLGDEGWGRLDELFFLPMDRKLGLSGFALILG